MASAEAAGESTTAVAVGTLESMDFFGPRVEYLGTSYYYSSLNYLGYSPFAPAEHCYDVKPEVSALFLQQTYGTNPIGLFMTVRTCLEQEMKIVQQVRGRLSRKAALMNVKAACQVDQRDD